MQAVSEETQTQNTLNLVDEVATILADAGLVENAHYLVSKMEEMGVLYKNPEIQRYYLNVFFNTQLMLSSEYSVEERYCLIPEGDLSVWLDMFKKKILNFLIRNNLPKPL